MHAKIEILGQETTLYCHFCKTGASHELQLYGIKIEICPGCIQALRNALSKVVQENRMQNALQLAAAALDEMEEGDE